MDYRIGCDAHKHYSQFAVLDEEGRLFHQARVDHQPGAIRTFLEAHPNGTPVALESVGNWYWIADEIEAAGCLPLLTHAAKAKLMMGHVDKTDKLDARGLATLLHNGTLPTVWLPPGAVRDQRDLPRTRMASSFRHNEAGWPPEVLSMPNPREVDRLIGWSVKWWRVSAVSGHGLESPFPIRQLTG